MIFSWQKMLKLDQINQQDNTGYINYAVSQLCAVFMSTS